MGKNSYWFWKTMSMASSNKETKITFGSTLAALRFAVKNRTKVVFEGLTLPPPYQKEELQREWKSLYFDLMLGGSVIGGDGFVSSKLTDDFIFVVSKGNIVNRIEYSNLYLFSDKNIIGLPPIHKENDSYTVIDILEPISLSRPHTNHIKTKDALVSDVYILKENSRKKTEIYSISKLTKKQLHEFDYSDTIVKFKCEDILKKNGFKGRKNGKKGLHIKLKTTDRKVEKNMDFYKNTKRLKFFYGRETSL